LFYKSTYSQVKFVILQRNKSESLKILIQMAKKSQFSKIGLIAATVGSAIGLGNVWRFPAETQSNGGAAFLILYIVCILILGIPVMLAEFSLGRSGRGDAIRAFQHLTPGQKWRICGAIATIES
jgi:NSS family neurotransmitter:Na+ symporter